jgi:trehalose 6-phosphate synthase
MSVNEMNEQQLLVVSNRLPISIKREPNGSYSSSPAAGGLVTALSGLAEATKFLWFGWPARSI